MAQPSLIDVHYVKWVEAHCHWQIYAVRFTLWTMMMTTTYRLRILTHITWAHWAGQNSGPVFCCLWTKVSVPSMSPATRCYHSPVDSWLWEQWLLVPKSISVINSECVTGAEGVVWRSWWWHETSCPAWGHTDFGMFYYCTVMVWHLSDVAWIMHNSLIQQHLWQLSSNYILNNLDESKNTLNIFLKFL